MTLTVTNRISIKRPISEVADYAMAPDHAPEWYENIKSVEWKTPKPLGLGSRVAFVAQFLGRRLAYTYEIVALEPEALLVMRTAEGPFPMETTYRFRSLGAGETEMELTNRGAPSGFSALVAPMMRLAMDRANRKDLKAIRRILEKAT